MLRGTLNAKRGFVSRELLSPFSGIPQYVLGLVPQAFPNFTCTFAIRAQPIHKDEPRNLHRKFLPPIGHTP